ncbi:conjugal transfer protein TraB [Chryseobacterium glaciei]|uniref:Conjugal transfer protein TraB n=1 Tax=Chryseobacterium glaciei TaxID=1685010 RepID=A0A172XTQ6_9FLAO|nr:DUF3408 domain-containing protein [Chryseobacterium glaciei]ANF50341.1 conjugal transfer protein TraB [Chryseobacterium glaciei]
MESDDIKKSFEKPVVDEALIMEIMSGKQPAPTNQIPRQDIETKESKPREKRKENIQKKISYEEVFLTNRYPSGRNGKVVYIRPEYHERLLRIVQLTREEKTTLYSYIDNILEHHFQEFGVDITDFFNERNKPIL